ncbi:MAG: hypothetical protein U5K54_04915 [Cytophagales bacterium]|nr:hypothetical protein [Cytophagales bacterium]
MIEVFIPQVVQVQVIKPTLRNTDFLLCVSADLNGDFMSGGVSLSEYLRHIRLPRCLDGKKMTIYLMRLA